MLLTIILITIHRQNTTIV